MVEYEDYLYDGFPYAHTHPDHLATLATLFALTPAPPTRCRVLELGCGVGANLVPMALALPESSFVGIDRSAPQIDVGTLDVHALGLQNLALHALDLREVLAAGEGFDYILCHGVYSWVPAEVQAKILEICRTLLLPNGVAYISFNTFPGWHLRGLIRDLLRREVGPSGTPEERLTRARAFLRFLEHIPEGGSPAQAWLKSELELLGSLSDAYLLYEHLAEHCQPIYFEDFARDAERAGLSYLADAQLAMMIPSRFGPLAEAVVAQRSEGILATEQSLDLLDLRCFRRTLLCHREAPIDRRVSFERLTHLWVSTRLAPVSASPELGADLSEAFTRTGTAELRTSLPVLKAALTLLAQDHPRGLPFDALCREVATRLHAPPESEEEDRDRLGSNLLGLYAQGQIDLGVRPLPYVTVPGPNPTTTALVRLQASRGQAGCTNLRHETIGVDAFERSLLQKLDGTRTRADLIEAMRADVEAGTITVAVDGEPDAGQDVLEEIVDKELSRLARAALLSA